ncbi:ficolin-2-like [Patiria miniata]|uniref:Fibrinogen C-terminal domain-containing protein n=1 Tax=Patiria miniata TaxID=46514 RepID=A0A914A7P2_PATMI|nr:ficolin-2-like [Patiria miniata]
MYQYILLYNLPKMAFIFTLLMMLCASQVSCCETSCGGLRLEHKLFSADHRALVNSVYKKKTAASQVICGRECSMDPECRSVNYHKCRKLCELSTATRREFPEAFVEGQGSVYFDADEKTPLFSLARNHSTRYLSCEQLFDAGFCSSGVYTIHPHGFDKGGLRVDCDMATDDGGWIMFQRRQDGSVDFYRTWAEYQSGFGNLSGEFWLGNDNLAKLMSDNLQVKWELRVDLMDWGNNTAWAKYQDFTISGTKYTLSFSTYDVNSTAGNALGRQNGMPFTTKDNENDIWQGGNCANFFHGAWWYKDCTSTNLNGRYYPYRNVKFNQGIKWNLWVGRKQSLKQCSMKMREI